MENNLNEGHIYITSNQNSKTSKDQNSSCHQSWKVMKIITGSLSPYQFIGLMIVSLLIGRGYIFEQMAPFPLAFFAAIFLFKREYIIPVTVFLVIGGLLSNESSGILIIMELSIFCFLHKVIAKINISQLTSLPIVVAVVVFVVRVIYELFHWGIGLQKYYITFSLIEALLALVCTFIFIQIVHVFMRKREIPLLKPEEIVVLVIGLAFIMQGTFEWTIGKLCVTHMFSAYVVLVFSMLGGAPIGAFVGLIIGLWLGLYEVNSLELMGLYACIGLFAGLFNQRYRLSSSLGLVTGSLIFSYYFMKQVEIGTVLAEMSIACMFLWVTPRTVLYKLGSHFFSSQGSVNFQQTYYQHVKDATVERISQFSNMFKAMISNIQSIKLQSDSEDIFHDAQSVAPKIIQNVFKKHIFSKNSESNQQHGLNELDLETIQFDLAHKFEKQIKKQLIENHQFIAYQLSGISLIMEDLLKEYRKECDRRYEQALKLPAKLESLGIMIHRMNILNLQEGNIDIEIIHAYSGKNMESRKIIAPFLSEIFQEYISVTNHDIWDKHRKLCRTSFASVSVYEIETGIATLASEGEFLSGDSYAATDLGYGKFAVALSDGMGNGARARVESSKTLDILQHLLKTGMNELTAVRFLNSFMLVSSPEEMYATLDMALIDLHSARTTFVKIGCTPSFIKRDQQVIIISANNLPVGIIQDIDVELISLELRAGDLLIMMTDGIYDSTGNIGNKEMWIKNTILAIDKTNPQEFAECLLDRIFQYHNNQINDDMTVIVAKMSFHEPKWKTFRNSKSNQSDLVYSVIS